MNTAVEQFLAALRQHGFTYRQQGRGYRAQCPCHQGGNHNLAINEGAEGKLLLQCKSHHCAFGDIMASLGLKREEPPAGPNGTHYGPPDREYPYRDEQGRILFYIGRFPGKKFLAYQRDAMGGMLWSTKGLRRPLFGLPELLQSKPKDLIAIPEGEKDALALAALGIISTTNPHGAGSWRDEHTAWLKQHLPDRQFAIIADFDPVGKDGKRPGEEHARSVFASLTGAGLRAHRVNLPGLLEGQDVSDWIAGRSEAEVKQALLPPRRTWVIGAEHLMSKEFPPMRWAVPEMIGEGLTILAGGTKAGKSYLALSAAVAVAAGGRLFGKITTQKGSVLYLALEDSERRLKDRMQDVLQGEKAPPGLDLAIEWPMLGDGFEESVAEWLEVHADARLIILDVLQKVRPPRARNSEPYDDDYRVTAMLQRLALPRRVALLALHHTRKMAADDPFDLISGSAGMTAAADGLMVLMRQRDQPEATLHFIGRDVSAQAWSLRWDSDLRSWAMLGDAALHQVSQQRAAIMKLMRDMNEDLGPKEIAEVLGASYGAIRRLVVKMVEDGELVRTTRGKYRLPYPLQGERGLY